MDQIGQPGWWHDGRTGVAGPAHDPLGVADESGTWVQVASRERLDEQITAGEAWFPIAVKANVAAQGLDYSAASAALAGARARVDSAIVAALRARGAVVVGSANMHELAFGITSNNAHTTAVRNPVDPSRSAGGSSGGSAAAVARGYVPVAVGTDTGGSISIPAALCGVTGWRPTVGRWPTDGLIGLSWTRDTPGVCTTDVAGAARVDQWVAGAAGAQPNAEPPRLRLGLPVQLHADLDADTARATKEAMTRLGEVADLSEIDLAPVLADLGECEWLTVAYEARRLLAAAVAEHHQVSPARAWRLLAETVPSPDVRRVVEAIEAEPVSDPAYAWAQQRIWRARRQYQGILEASGVDALVFPTTPRGATPIGQDELVRHNGRPEPIFALMTRHTMPGTLLRAPMLTVPIPLTRSGALPVGLTIQATAFDDTRILAVGRRIEQALTAPELSAPASRPDRVHGPCAPQDAGGVPGRVDVAECANVSK